MYARLVVTTVTKSEYGEEEERGKGRRRKCRERVREKVGINVTIYMWVQIEHYSVAYFNSITIFEVL